MESEKTKIDQILFPDEPNVCIIDIIDINIKSEVKTEIDDVCEKEYGSIKVIPEQLFFVGQKRKNTENHEIINQKNYNEELEELKNEKANKIQTLNEISEKEYQICKEEYLEESEENKVEIDVNNSGNLQIKSICFQENFKEEFEELYHSENEPTVPAVKLLKVQTVKLKALSTKPIYEIQPIKVSVFMNKIDAKNTTNDVIILLWFLSIRTIWGKYGQNLRFLMLIRPSIRTI
jgi:hypothetical protein